jgi:hypothetical protein
MRIGRQEASVNEDQYAIHDITDHLRDYGCGMMDINKYFCCVLYLTQIGACVNKFITVWTCVPHMNAHKNLRDIQRTRSIRCHFFKSIKEIYAVI